MKQVDGHERMNRNRNRKLHQCEEHTRAPHDPQLRVELVQLVVWWTALDHAVKARHVCIGGVGLGFPDGGANLQVGLAVQVRRLRRTTTPRPLHKEDNKRNAGVEAVVRSPE